MLIKEKNWKTEFYDLLGDDEKALTSAFAYLMAENESAFRIFLKGILKIRPKKDIYAQAKIEIEKHGKKDGRTDIEITANDLHIIIEGKVNNGVVQKQWEQYNNRFNDGPTVSNHLVAITSIPTVLGRSSEDINFHNTTWKDIYDVLNDYARGGDDEDRDRKSILSFISFYERRYLKMLQKEILVQDLKNQEDLDLLTENAVYKRDIVHGIPLYFAPYITKNSGRDYGISKIYKVLAVYQSNTKDDYWKTAAARFLHENPELTEYKNLFDKWIKGFERIRDMEKGFTLYFLDDEPIVLPKTVLKGGAIMNQIPKNYSISFKQLFQDLANQSN